MVTNLVGRVSTSLINRHFPPWALLVRFHLILTCTKMSKGLKNVGRLIIPAKKEEEEEEREQEK